MTQSEAHAALWEAFPGKRHYIGVIEWAYEDQKKPQSPDFTSTVYDVGYGDSNGNLSGSGRTLAEAVERVVAQRPGMSDAAAMFSSGKALAGVA